MTRMTRRQFLKASGAGCSMLAVAGLPGCAMFRGDTEIPSGRRVVVVGGGWGGATAAKYVRLADPTIEVILLEPNKKFVSCPFSNLVLSGARGIGSLTFGYGGLRDYGVKVRHEAATAIEPDTKRVRIGDGALAYDRVIVAPGVDFQVEQVEGLGAAQDTVLHAWKAGPQTVELAKQLRAMPDGGVFVLTVPPVAYRCPPGPYERICQVAWYLKTNKPKSKLIVLDADQNIVSKAALFRAAWQAYPNIDYRASNKVQSHPAPARGHHRGPGRPRRRRQAVVRGRSRHLRVGEAPQRPRHRRRHNRPAGAEVGDGRQRHGQDLRERGRDPHERAAGALGAAGQHLLLVGERPRGDGRRQRLQDRQRQGRPGRAEAHPRSLHPVCTARRGLGAQHLDGHPWLGAER